MTLKQFCDQHDLTPAERKLVYRYLLWLRFARLLDAVEKMPEE